MSVQFLRVYIMSKVQNFEHFTFSKNGDNTGYQMYLVDHKKEDGIYIYVDVNTHEITDTDGTCLGDIYHPTAKQIADWEQWGDEHDAQCDLVEQRKNMFN